jgi:hypothetical protein
MSSTEQTRLELLAALSELSRIRPEWRLGQTVANLAMTAGRLDAGGVWDLEDDEALSATRRLIAQYSEIDAEVAEPGAAPDRSRSVGSVSQDGVAGGPGC